MRLMYDGINTDAAAIRALKPSMVAVYLDGRYAWSQNDRAGFPVGCVMVGIVVFPTSNMGAVIDCENGDATPAQAAEWVRIRKASGFYRPTIYCSRNLIPTVRVATGSLVLGSDYDIWVADWTGAAHQVTSSGPGVSVKLPVTQFKSGAQYDTSMVYDAGWPHSVAPKPPVPVPVKPPIPVPVGPPLNHAESITITTHYSDGATKTSSVTF